MKQQAGYAVMFTVLMASMRLSQAPTQAAGTENLGKASAAAQPANPSPSPAPNYTGQCTALLPAPETSFAGTTYPRDPNQGAAKTVIDAFLGDRKNTPTQPSYVIALVPDPIHTNLSLRFDREMSVLQQAAQEEGYSYDSSWLPWRFEATAYSRIEDQQRAADLTDQREACPGILLFRKSSAAVAADDRYPQGLMVFVVGEQPTGGLNQDQWNNAIEYIVAHPSAASGLRVLGPTFSGSMPSLTRALHQADKRFSSVSVLSGNVSSCSAVNSFREQRPDVFFGTFQENDDLKIYRFLNYLRAEHATPTEGSVAILSEDETAYGGSTNSSPPGKISSPPGKNSSQEPCEFKYQSTLKQDDRPLRLYYPRDISALRTAYQKQSLFSGGAAASKSIHAVLQEGIDSTSASDSITDTIPAFSGEVTAIAQEALLFSIVDFLRIHHTRFVLLRCSNPLDFLFLTRFFHRTYPEGRIVTVEADDLFGREIDTTEFRGVMALSNYPLLPANQHWSNVNQKTLSHAHHVFEAQNEEGVYLAARYLFDPAALPACKDQTPSCLLPYKIGLTDYADPFWIHANNFLVTNLSVPTWLAVAGRQGYWPVAILTGETTPDEHLDGQIGKSVAPTSTVLTLTDPSLRTKLADPPPRLEYEIQDGSPRVFLGKLPLTWQFCFLLALLLYGYQAFGIARGPRRTSWGLFAPFRHNCSKSHSVLLGLNCALAAMVPVELLSVFLSPPPLTPYLTYPLPFAFGICVIALLIGSLAFLLRRRSRLCLGTFAGVALFLLAGLVLTLVYGLRSANAYPLFYRMSHLTGGVSPLVPVLFLTVGLYLWSWQAMAGAALTCEGRPLLPDLGSFNAEYYRISQMIANRIFKAAGTLSYSPTLVLFCALLFVLAMIFDQWHGLALLGMEGRGFAVAMNVGLLCSIVLTVQESVRLLFTWIELRRLLAALNRLRLRRTLAALKAIEVSSLWGVSGNVQRVQYVLFTRQLEAGRRLQHHYADKLPKLALATVAGEIFARQSASALTTGSKWNDPVTFPDDSSCRPETGTALLRPLLNSATAEILTSILDDAWRQEGQETSMFLEPASPAAKPEQDEADSGAEVACGMQLSGKPVVRAAEEFICFHYISFIQNILARMRTMVLAIGYLFVALCLTISFYPFVPRTEISVWLVGILAVVGSVVVYVYLGMERDPTLNFITGTASNKLTGAFWIKTLGFLAGPVIGILTTQFPGIADSVLGWLQPGLESMGK